MYSKSFIVSAAAAVLLAGSTAAHAANFTDPRDSGWFSQRQLQLDREYTRTHPTIIPGTPPALMTPGGAYGQVPPHRPAKRPLKSPAR